MRAVYRGKGMQTKGKMSFKINQSIRNVQVWQFLTGFVEESGTAFEQGFIKRVFLFKLGKQKRTAV